MTRLSTRSYLAIALLLLGALALGACDASGQSNIVTVPGAQAGTAALAGAASTAGTNGATGAAQNMLVTASSLLDLDLQNQGGEDIGQIEDFIVNMQNGNIPYVTVEYGGVLDIGDTEVAVPPTAFAWTGTSGLALNVDETVLENYPEMDQGWTDFANPAWDDQMYGFWQNAGATPGYDNMENAASSGDNLAWASDLVGYGVEDIGFGDGIVHSMLVDPSLGAVTYVVLAFQPDVFQDDLIAVPISALVWQGQGNNLAFRQDVNQDVLSTAPGFTAGDLQNGTLDASSNDELGNYWGNAGYAAAPGAAVGDATGAAADQTNAGQTGAGQTGAGQTGETAQGVTGIGDAYVLGSTLLDYDFESIDGDTTGEIEDVILDSRDGRVLFVTVEYGGFLDIGDTELPMPLSAFGIGPSGRLVLRFQDEVLENFPDLGTSLNDFADPAWEDDAVSFWRSAGFDPGFDINEVSNTIIRASDLTGYGVADTGYGDGSVQDIVVNLGTARAPYVLVNYGAQGVGGALGLANDGSHHVVVPFSAFDASRFGANFAFGTDFDSRALESAPMVNTEAFGTGALDPAIANEWNTYWGNRGIDAVGTD
jgi:sporulation protein YlmC with PRC-barrel domain